VPCGRINSVAEALDDPHTAARAMVETAEHPALGALKMLGMPFKFSDTECSVRPPPTKRGEHADEILAGRRFAASSPVPSGYSENTRTHLTERVCQHIM
jgi:CoA:oxalate CoA-transferase